MINKIKVLLCEDELNLGNLLVEILQSKGYEVSWYKDGLEGWKAFSKSKFDLVLLDVMLPSMDGYAIAKEIRTIDVEVPIVFLTAMGMRDNVLEGLRRGADDYIAKPFSMEELLLRLEAILRRSGKLDHPELVTREQYFIGKFTFNTKQQTLTLGDQVQRMTTKETELLTLLCKFVNQTLERAYALETIWGINEKSRDQEGQFTQRSMDVYITKLRRMLAADPELEIKNIHGKGYKLIVPEVER